MWMWLITIITAAGSSVITCVVMEAYYTRRATEWVSEWEYEGIELEPRYSPGEKRFCTDCNDREACASGYPCSVVKAVAS